MAKNYLFIGLFFLLFFHSCNKPDKEDIEQKKEILTKHTWGYPRIQYQSPDTQGSMFLFSPTIFRGDGTVTIGYHYDDYWEFLDENTLLFVIADIHWDIQTLNDSIMHVYMVKSTEVDIFLECIYEPVE